MDRAYGEFVGVEEVHAGLVTEDSKDKYDAEAPEYLAPTAEITQAATVSTNPQYYDNVPGSNYVGESATVINITVSGVPAKTAAKYLGKHYDEATGRVLDDGQPKPPYATLSFRLNKGAADYRYYQYLKGTFTGGNEDAKSKGNGSVDVKTYTLTYTAINTIHKWDVDGERMTLKRIFADTTDEKFTGADAWFSAVQVPGAAAAAAAETGTEEQ